MFNIEKFLDKYYKENEAIILACSAGGDSMFLLYEILKTKYKKDLVVCYFNHKIRKESDIEEKFLESLGEKFGFKVEIGYAYIKEIQQKYPSITLEELARNKRYDFLGVIRDIYKSPYILTAHHLDDKIETFFFNLARGSKLTGLINMTEKSGLILRPLLNLEKKYILKYLEDNKLEYKIDITNYDINITRNYLRNEIIPKFEKINSKYKQNINNTLNYFEELKNHIDNEVKIFLDIENNQNYFSMLEFKNLSFFLQKEIIRYIYYITNGNSTIGLSEANINEIIKFINSKNNKTIKEIKNLKMKKDKDLIYYK